MKSLLLWDIDGTLVNADGTGRRAMLQAMKDCFAVKASFDGFEIAGCTDRQLLEWLLGRHDLEKSENNFQKCAARYTERLKTEMALGKIHTYDGVESFLQTAARRPDIFQGLLTGKPERGGPGQARLLRPETITLLLARLGRIAPTATRSGRLP